MTNSVVAIMDNRSSLEMMLEKIQQLEDQPKDELPPALPVRPALRGRLPRTKKPLQLCLNGRVFESNSENGEYSFNQQFVAEKYNGSVSTASQIKQLEILDDVVEKGVASIQRWFRGHQVRCFYKDFRSQMIVLQSFARGENARKEYRFLRKRLRAIILIQKRTGKYIEGRHVQSCTSIHEPNLEKNKPARNDSVLERDGDVKVPYSFVTDLHKQVLKTEAKVREKKWEHNALKIKLQEMDQKWLQHEERMKSMEKEWQVQFTYIQKCLAAGKRNSGPIITFKQYDTIQEHYNQNVDDNVKRSPDGRSLDLVNTRIFRQDKCTNLEKKLHPDEELRKLKVKFKTWKKEYRNKLREAHLTFKKLGNTEITGKSQRNKNNWWGRLFTH